MPSGFTPFLRRSNGRGNVRFRRTAFHPPFSWAVTSGASYPGLCADLFTAISTTYGVGDGSSTFNLPDLRGRVPAGQDDMGGASANRLTSAGGGLDGDVLGGAGGSETHTLIVAELPIVSQRSTTATSNPAHGDSAPAAVAGNVNVNVGGDAPHRNVQPTLILNYIIRS